MSTQHDVEVLDQEECWSLLQRAAASSQLKRASRLREFLFYVAGKSLKENCPDIHEQEIGHFVFGRNEHYDTSQDNIVRVNATELRKRIETFFEKEGADEPLIFEIPRGSYTPVFHRRAIPPPKVPAIAQIETPAPAAIAPKRQLPFILVSTLAVLLAATSIALWIQNNAFRKVIYKWDGSPALAALWPRFLNSPQETDIILADTSFSMIEDINKQSYPLSDYLNRSYINQIQSPTTTTEQRIQDMLASRTYGSLGDFRVAQQIEALDRGSTRVFVDYARDYTTDSIKRNNVILIGSHRSNPWVELFSDQMNFMIEYDPNMDQMVVKNLNPRSGEQPLYEAPANLYSSIGYSIIAYLPNPSHTANALIIEGTNSEATNAAGDFVTSEPSMSSFLQRLHTKQFPYFELLLKTTRMSGTPFHAEIISYRTY